MIDEYKETRNVDEVSAKEIVDSQLDKMKSCISYEYVGDMDYIDKKVSIIIFMQQGLSWF